MVSFCVFNELSLPLSDIKEFDDFFKVIAEIKTKGLSKIRMDRKFTEYPEILPKKTLQEIVNTIPDRDKKLKLKIFIKNQILLIETPIIKNDKTEQTQTDLKNGTEYFFEEKSTNGGLACCDIWNTIAVSFNSADKWNNNEIEIEKRILTNNGGIVSENKNIKHVATPENLDSHSKFFEDLEKEKKLNITKSNFWKNRTKNFPNKIIFCKEVEEQIKNLDKQVFQSAISILRDVETGRKKLTDYNWSGESDTVKNNSKSKSERMFTLPANNEKVFFENHVKSLPSGNRIYFMKKPDGINIGYIGKHLTTKKDKS